jgi:hypothetical protein
MTNHKFKEILDARIEKMRQLLRQKGNEYTIGDNVFHNFDRAAAILDSTPTKALWGMYVKHHVSVELMVNGQHPPDTHVVSEKIGDMINYLVLLEAILYEQDQDIPF